METNLASVLSWVRVHSESSLSRAKFSTHMAHLQSILHHSVSAPSETYPLFLKDSHCLFEWIEARTEMESGVGQYEKLIVHYQKTEKLPMNQRNQVFKQKKTIRETESQSATVCPQSLLPTSVELCSHGSG